MKYRKISKTVAHSKTLLLRLNPPKTMSNRLEAAVVDLFSSIGEPFESYAVVEVPLKETINDDK